MNKKNDEILGAYVSETETASNDNTAVKQEQTGQGKEYVPLKGVHVGGNFNDVKNPFNNESAKTVNRYENNLGYLKIDVKSLPTQGLFYPDNIEISIRAARGEEIKHWSTMDESSIEQLSKTDDILNYIIERCVMVKMPGIMGANCWKDLKSVDRLYLLLAVREFTFPKGQNELHIPVKEGKDIPVEKEMIDYINIPDELMEFYSQEDKCFVFNMPNGTPIKIHIPSIGVNDWLKTYASGKINAREGYDEDFLNFAPMLIRDWRDLNVRKYEELVQSTTLWGVTEWSTISYVMDILSKASSPMFKYTDESGVESQIPVTFRGGFKAIFTVHNPLQFLR